jgi:CelD/BcsL family acetyltransferase involved in cellulose biosynthesis
MSHWLAKAIKQWVVLAVRSDTDASRHVAFFALRPITRFKKGIGLYNELGVACQGMSNYTGLICDPAVEDRAIPALAQCLQGMHWANLNLESFKMSDERFELFRKSFPQTTFRTRKLTYLDDIDGRDPSLCPSLSLADDWETYLATKVGSNTRQKIRRFLRKVDEGDEFRITHADGDTAERDLDTLLRLWGTKWDEKKGDAADEIKKVNRLMLLHCFRKDALFLPTLWQGDRPLGALVIVVDRVKKSYLFKITGRDETFKGPPPGFILHAHAICHAIANGMRTYDFLQGNDPYKYLFGSEDRRVRFVALATKNGRNLNKTLDVRSLANAVKLADRLRQSGKLGEAERAYRQILESDTGHQPALLALVSLLQTKGDTKGAQKVMSSMLKAPS